MKWTQTAEGGHLGKERSWGRTFPMKKGHEDGGTGSEWLLGRKTPECCRCPFEKHPLNTFCFEGLSRDLTGLMVSTWRIWTNAWCKRETKLFCNNKERLQQAWNMSGGSWEVKEVEGLKWEEEENGESWKTEWQKLRKLIIETEGSAAPREIDAKEGSGSLGITGNYPLHQRLLSLAFPQNRRVYQCPSVLPQAPLRPDF